MMIIFYGLLIGIVLIAMGIVGFLFYLFNKETNKPTEQKVEPIAIINDNLMNVGPTENELNYRKRVEELESELKEISDKGTMQASDAIALIDQLTKENQSLKMKNFETGDNDAKFLEVQQQADQLRQDSFVLSNQLELAHTKVSELEQEAMLIKQAMEADLQHAATTIETLKAEKEAIILNRESSSQSTQSLTRDIDELRTQAVNYQSEIAILRETNDQLKASSESMFQQTQMFQQELLCQRAQISGLERICENYRLQVEEKV